MTLNTFETILVERRASGMWEIMLNRPEVHNAFNSQMIADLTYAFKAADKASDCRFVLLTSNCASFCAGADLEWMRAAANYTKAENQRDALALANMLHTIDTCGKTTVAIAAGKVFGGGVGLVSVCDIVIGTPATKLCLSEVKLGLIPATIAPFVVRTIGPRQARRYFQSAELIDADTAHKIGLLHELVEEHQVGQTLRRILTSLAKGSPEAQTNAKRLISDCWQSPITDNLLKDMAERIAEVRTTSFAKEGLQAFFDKRQPRWVNDIEETDVKISTNR